MILLCPNITKTKIDLQKQDKKGISIESKRVYITTLILDNNLPENKRYVAVKLEMISDEEPLDIEPGTHYEISMSPVEVQKPESVKSKLNKTSFRRNKSKH